MTRVHAGVKRVTIHRLRLSALLRQSPDVIAFLEQILGDGKTGAIKLDVKDGQALSWAFRPARRRKES